MITRWLLAPIGFYRRHLSGLKSVPTCRFVPTCSEYAYEAIQRRGPIVGLAKALWRLLRCNPLCRGGFDPVDRSETPRDCRHTRATSVVAGPAQVKS